MTETLLQVAYKAIDDKRAEDIVVLNMQNISLLSRLFYYLSWELRSSNSSDCREVQEKAEENGFDVKRVEGYDSARWILVI